METKQLKDIEELKYVGKRKRKTYLDRLREFPTSRAAWEEKKIKILKEKQEIKHLYISPYSNMLYQERYCLEKIREKHGEGTAEAFRVEHLFTDDEDLDIKFFVYMLRTYPD